jgi:hypothetical protein
MRFLTFAFVGFLFCAVSVHAQGTTSGASATSTSDETIARIVGHSLTSNGAMEFLQTLTDTIGGRITGSEGSREAAELILGTLKDAGFENAHTEEYKLPSVWQHGAITGEVIAPVRRALVIGSYGWVPGTPGPIEVAVSDYGSAAGEHVTELNGLKGTAVIVDLRSNGLSTAYVGTREVLSKQLAKACAAAMMIVSDKPDRMVYTSAFGFYPRAALPVLSIASEDAALLRRLLAKGAVKIRLDVQNSFASGPGTERNVVADLPGEDIREMVLMMAHFDDWDPAQGANDNGAGVAVILEAARFSSVWEFVRSTPFALYLFLEKKSCRTDRARTLSGTNLSWTTLARYSTLIAAHTRRWVSRFMGARTWKRHRARC